MIGLRGYVESALLGALGWRRPAAPAEARQPETPRSGFVIGTVLRLGSLGPEPGSPYVVPDDYFRKHWALYGGSGSGKSTLLRRLRRHAYSAGENVVDIDFLETASTASSGSSARWATTPRRCP